MTKTIALALITAVAFTACGRSSHKAPLNRNLRHNQQQQGDKAKAELVSSVETRLTGIYGSLNAFKTLSSSELSKKLQSDLKGVTLTLESVQNEISGDEYMSANLSTVKKSDKKCDVKNNQQTAYLKSAVLSKDNKSTSNLRCLEDDCKNVLLIIEDRKEIKIGNRTEIDYGVMAVVLKKGNDNKYNPITINSDLISKVSSSEDGALRCAEQVLGEMNRGNEQAPQVDIAQIIRQDNERQTAESQIQMLSADPLATP
ncbi:MAG: hypothetical protein K2Q26_04215 [Bdellovibrionales bacterium]|nr:hypothetical protein [Bdellovibrionales bacterium]